MLGLDAQVLLHHRGVLLGSVGFYCHTAILSELEAGNTVMQQKIFQLAQQLGQQLIKRQMMMATAESCTGGGIASAITDAAGSSQWFDRGFVTYSNQAKMDMLGVKAETLKTEGAVSQETAIEMAAGCLRNSTADITVAVTGIAGPGGGSQAKPVGTVFIGLAVKGKSAVSQHYMFEGDRAAIRQQTVYQALKMVMEAIA